MIETKHCVYSFPDGKHEIKKGSINQGVRTLNSSYFDQGVVVTGEGFFVVFVVTGKGCFVAFVVTGEGRFDDCVVKIEGDFVVTGEGGFVISVC